VGTVAVQASCDAERRMIEARDTRGTWLPMVRVAGRVIGGSQRT
jgi:hypothetical protein